MREQITLPSPPPQPNRHRISPDATENTAEMNSPLMARINADISESATISAICGKIRRRIGSPDQAGSVRSVPSGETTRPSGNSEGKINGAPRCENQVSSSIFRRLAAV
jgi:hypothetical protein